MGVKLKILYYKIIIFLNNKHYIIQNLIHTIHFSIFTTVHNLNILDYSSYVKDDIIKGFQILFTVKIK